jgi:L-ascorbate metabolism protein UlaG (beta-lactamase superfamily)
MTTRLVRWGHSCVRFERGDDALVVDPGTFSDLDHALDGVAAILVTHEHPDHVEVEPVAAAVAAGADVWAPAGVLTALRDAGAPTERLHEVRGGDELEVGGFDVRVLGEWHAVIHPDVPRVANVGYLVAGVLHPGDAYVDPQGAQVDVLLTPVGAPWLRLREVVAWVRGVAPGKVVMIHDALLSDAGRASARALVARLAGAGELVALGPGEGIDVG